MSKITIICCIIAAVCIHFQNAEAINLPRLPIVDPLGLMNNAQDNTPATDTVTSYILDKIPGLRSLKNIQAFMRGVQNFDISSCTNLYKEGRQTYNQLISIGGTCVTNEISNVNTENWKEIKNNLLQAVRNLIQSITEYFQNFFQNSVSQGLAKVWQNLDTLNSVIEEALDAIRLKFKTFIPNFKNCVQTEFSELIHNSDKLFESLRQCSQSVREFYKYFNN